MHGDLILEETERDWGGTATGGPRGSYIWKAVLGELLSWIYSGLFSRNVLQLALRSVSRTPAVATARAIDLVIHTSSRHNHPPSRMINYFSCVWPAGCWNRQETKRRILVLFDRFDTVLVLRPGLMTFSWLLLASQLLGLALGPAMLCQHRDGRTQLEFAALKCCDDVPAQRPHKQGERCNDGCSDTPVQKSVTVARSEGCHLASHLLSSVWVPLPLPLQPELCLHRAEPADFGPSPPGLNFLSTSVVLQC